MLSFGQTDVPATGQDQEFTVQTGGLLDASLWGAGGGGGRDLQSRALGRGGAGGKTTVTIPVVPGDVVKVMVGTGGKKAIASGQAPGGWPDGGAGNFWTTPTYAGAGGGGSTRIYVNNVLKAVAGGGGGMGATGAGGGGGLSGQNAATVAGYTGGGTGGTQTAGGLAGGGFLQGGASPTSGNLAGGGGGGGYYGGGGNNSANIRGGGGGSGWIDPALSGTLTEGSYYTAPDPPVAGIGAGAVGGYADDASNHDGGDGFAVLNLRPYDAIDLVPGKQSVPYSGEAKVITVPEDGLIDVKMWGGAGSGGAYSSGSGGSGGAGGFVAAQLLVKAGDVIKVETARGGQQTLPSAAAAGPGGWPDGGQGGKGTSRHGGSGGGSSRIWLNDELVLVAGGGGGGVPTNNSAYGGAGGGLRGLDGGGTYNYAGQGATQWYGGHMPANGSDSNNTGGRLKGGLGFPDGTAANQAQGSSAGAGGGGGYHGGAGSRGNNSTSSSGGAGGGSSYIHVKALNAKTLAGERETPPAIDDPDYVAGIAVGSAVTTSTPRPAGDGLTVLNFSPAGSLGEIEPQQPTPVPATQASRDFRIPANGSINFKLWGGGGGGTWWATEAVPTYGGAGGFVAGWLNVVEGDVVRVETASGGQAPDASGGGYGGWPDGGEGGVYSATRRAGGGGGSTRVYLNGVLMAVAGGGGSAGGGGNKGGSAGGAVGETGQGVAGVYFGGPGGTQSSGGAGSLAEFDGGYLKGGFGYPKQDGRVGRTNGATGDFGAAGGGGFYGGAGAGNIVATAPPAGGGGSSYINSGVIDGEDIPAPADHIPAKTDDSDYVAGVGVGGLNSGASTTPPSPGGPGHGALFFVAGDVDIIPAEFELTTPLGPITNTAPGATATALREIFVALPTITVIGDLGGQPQLEAVVITAVSAYDLTSEPPQVDVSGEVDLDIDDGLTPIKVIALRYILGGGGELYDPIVFDVTPPEGMGEEVPDYDALIDSVLLVTPPEALLSGGSGAFEVGDARNPDRPWARLIVTSPQGTMAGADQNPAFSMPAEIGLTSPEGEVFFPVFYTANPTDPAIVTPPGASAAGQATIDAPVGFPKPLFLSRVFVQSPASTVSAGANVDVFNIGLVVVGQPGARFESYADVRVNFMPAVYVQAPRAIAFEGQGQAIDGDLSTAVILIIPPLIEASGDTALSAEPGMVTLLAPEGFVEPIAGTNGAIRFKRSLIAGRTPASLSPREPAWNDADGVFFAGDAEGSVVSARLGDMGRGGLVPPGGQPGDVLYADGVWRQPQPAFIGPIKPSPAAGRRVLTEAALGPAERRPQTGVVFYRPFFLPRPTTLKRLGFTVATGGATSATIHFGLCHWDVFTARPNGVAHAASATSTAEGDRSVAVNLSLPQGWYAAMFAVVGAAPLLEATVAPVSIAPDFTAEGDWSAPFAGALIPAPTPAGAAADAYAYVWMET